MSHDDLRRLLGGYLLGGLDDADTERLDDHVLTCDECRAELARLAVVPDLLRRAPSVPPAAVTAGARPTPERIQGLLGRMRGDRARERRRTLTRRLAIAAAVLLIAAISGGLALDRSGDRPQAAPSPGQPRVVATFASAAGGTMAGEAVLTGRTWGVSIDLTMAGISGHGPFVCQVSTLDGVVEQAAMWGPTPSGRARVTGASSIQLGKVSAVAVTDTAGHVLGTARLH